MKKISQISHKFSKITFLPLKQGGNTCFLKIYGISVARKNFQYLHLHYYGVIFYRRHIKTGERDYEIPYGSQQLECF